jgi:hypothetical protein
MSAFALASQSKKFRGVSVYQVNREKYDGQVVHFSIKHKRGVVHGRGELRVSQYKGFGVIEIVASNLTPQGGTTLTLTLNEVQAGRLERNRLGEYSIIY